MMLIEDGRDYSEDEIRNTDCIAITKYHKYWLAPGVRNPKVDEDSRLLLDFKDPNCPNHETAKKIIADALIHGVLPHLVSKTTPMMAAYVPGHEAKKRNLAMGEIIKTIAKEFKILNNANPIHRAHKVDKLAHGGNRDIQVHLNSIALTKGLDVTGHRVLLLDDITTSGNSMKACKQILLKAGATLVIPIAFGMTTN